MLRMTVKEFRERFGNQVKKSKYKNEPIEIDGHKFPSHKEANRYCELKLLQEAGKIFNLRLQVKFELIPNQYELLNGRRGKLLERKTDYVADFVYMEDGKLVVEDVKSKATKTQVYIIKRKLMLKVHGIRIKEV